MKKHPYQTCLRMPLTHMEEMTTICDEYHINESDLMRRAIVEFVENIKQTPQQNSRYKYLSGSYHKEPMGGGTGRVDNRPDKEWKYPSPNRIAEYILKQACSR